MSLLVIASAVLSVLCGSAALPLPVQERKDTSPPNDRIRSELIRACREKQSKVPAKDFKHVDDVSQLIERVGSPWPKEWFPVQSYLDGDRRTVLALPRELLIRVSYGDYDPSFTSPVTKLAFVCDGFTATYDISPITFADCLEESLTDIGAKIGAPDDLRQKAAKWFADRTELDLWRAAYERRPSDQDYEDAPTEELYAWAVHWDVLLPLDTVFPTVREVTCGKHVLLVESFGSDLVASKIVEYSLFLNGALYYRVAVYKSPEKAEHHYGKEREEALAALHRSILKCALRLPDADEAGKE